MQLHKMTFNTIEKLNVGIVTKNISMDTLVLTLQV